MGFAGVTAAQKQIWAWFENLTHQQWSVGFNGFTGGHVYTDKDSIKFASATGYTASTTLGDVADFKASEVWYARSTADFTEAKCINDAEHSTFATEADMNKVDSYRYQ